MSGKAVTERTRRASAGHFAFALTLLGSGIQGLVGRIFAPIWEPVPAGVPGRPLLILVCALVPLIAGAGLLWKRSSAPAARLLLGFLLSWFLLLRLPFMAVAFSVGSWYSACQTAVMLAAAWILHARFAGEVDGKRLGLLAPSTGVRIARILYALALIPFGLAHFLYPQATAPLVPHWMPAPELLANLTGGTFIAAGISILAGRVARPAAVLSALQIGLFTLLVWVPVVVKGANAGQWGEFVVSWMLTTAACVVAETYFHCGAVS